ncbi:hypothetical protein [Streptomyces brasiliensis]|uniref:hypothetical protein n=1 Tax=Streptomyces brasiliensis TaxID=1954 RepID=UPI001E4FC203|nr:hypothetical protein [Streptomyces brasiliensis]
MFAEDAPAERAARIEGTVTVTWDGAFTVRVYGIGWRRWASGLEQLGALQPAAGSGLAGGPVWSLRPGSDLPQGRRVRHGHLQPTDRVSVAAVTEHAVSRTGMVNGLLSGRPGARAGLEFGRIAEVLNVSVTGARQLASRARRRVAEAKQSTPQASKAERERVLTAFRTAFRAAYEAGDLAGLLKLLHPDAVYVTDGGGKVPAARKLIHGGERVAEAMARTGRQWHHPDRTDFAEVGRELALVVHREGQVYSVDTIQITDGLITAYRRVINPDKLVRVGAATPGGATSSP